MIFEIAFIENDPKTEIDYSEGSLLFALTA